MLPTDFKSLQPLFSIPRTVWLKSSQGQYAPLSFLVIGWAVAVKNTLLLCFSQTNRCTQKQQQRSRYWGQCKRASTIPICRNSTTILKRGYAYRTVPYLGLKSTSAICTVPLLTPPSPQTVSLPSGNGTSTWLATRHLQLLLELCDTLLCAACSIL